MTENHLGDNESEGDAPDDDDELDEVLGSNKLLVYNKHHLPEFPFFFTCTY